jgi:hypothetical protein
MNNNDFERQIKVPNNNADYDYNPNQIIESNTNPTPPHSNNEYNPEKNPEHTPESIIPLPPGAEDD